MRLAGLIAAPPRSFAVTGINICVPSITLTKSSFASMIETSTVDLKVYPVVSVNAAVLEITVVIGLFDTEPVNEHSMLSWFNNVADCTVSTPPNTIWLGPTLELTIEIVTAIDVTIVLEVPVFMKPNVIGESGSTHGVMSMLSSVV